MVLRVFYLEDGRSYSSVSSIIELFYISWIVDLLLVILPKSDEGDGVRLLALRCTFNIFISGSVIALMGFFGF